MGLKPTAKIEYNDHPSMDGTSRFAIDALIRKYGYRIYRRVGNDPLWAKGNVVIRQNDLLEALDRNEVADAEYEEYLYAEGE